MVMETCRGCLGERVRGEVCENCHPVSVSVSSKIQQTDIVNNPKHYQLFADGMESFDVIRRTLDHHEYIGFLKGNILKYRLRAGKKGVADICLAKADWYEDELTKYIESII